MNEFQVKRQGPALSIVVPTYNEEGRLGRCLRQLHRSARERHWGDDFEVIVVDDGSRDRTVEIAREELERFECGRLVGLPWHAGKGAAVRLGVTAAHGEAIAFMDADLATELSALSDALAALRDAEMAIGSRAIAGAQVTGRSRSRELLHRFLRSQVHLLTGVSASDPQCGFKVFKSEAAKLLFPISRVNGFAFDIELLLIAQKVQYRTVEIPVRWHAVKGSHVRVLRDSLAVLRDCLRIGLRYRLKTPLAQSALTPADLRAASKGRETVHELVR